MTYVDGAEEIDAAATFRQIRLSFGGVLYLDGGWSGIVDGLTKVANAAGAVLQPSNPVRALEPGGDGWVAHDGRGGGVTAKAVVLAIAPEQVAKLLPASPDIAEATGAVMPIACVGIDLALSGLPHPESQYALGLDEPVSVACHSTYAQLAPPGGSLFHLLRYLAPGEQPSRRHSDQLVNAMDRLQPGWAALEVHRQRLFGARVANDFPSARREGRRTPSAVADSPGIFLAGDWIGDEGMLSDASAASAEVAALAAIGHAVAAR